MPQTQPQPHDHDDPEQLRIRKEKREQMLGEGRSPYPVAVDRTHTLAQVRAAHPDLEAGQET
ncbi:MAG: lysine--tRNA ligase, partial [Brevibacterium yomogidense]